MIFPLPSTVLFPHMQLPLHIFEPRYRQMARDALDQQRPIAMALVDGSKPDDEFGRPAVHPVVGVGRIDARERLPDGRYLIVLKGLARARIVAEYAPEKAYREVRAQLLEDTPADPAQVAALLETFDQLVLALRSVNARLAKFLTTEREDHPDPGVFSFRAAPVVGGAESQQRLLEQTDVAGRLDLLVTRLAEILARASAPNMETN